MLFCPEGAPPPPPPLSSRRAPPPLRTIDNRQPDLLPIKALHEGPQPHALVFCNTTWMRYNLDQFISTALLAVGLLFAHIEPIPEPCLALRCAPPAQHHNTSQ
jgi:hypothetical protein